MIGTDVLRNSASFAKSHICLSDCVKNRGFAVIDMAHDRNDRWTGNQRSAFLSLVKQLYSFFFGDTFLNLLPEVGCKQHGRIDIDCLVHRRHNTQTHELGNDFAGFDAHPGS